MRREPTSEAPTLMANAWTGEEPGRGRVVRDYGRWATAESRRLSADAATSFLPPPGPDPNNWADRRVGWGVIAAEPPEASPARLRAGDDLPEPIRALLQERGGPILRYRPGWKHHLKLLRDYAAGKDISLATRDTGLGPGKLPRHLLIVGPPTAVPWRLQYILQSRPDTYVGRLDLDPDGLDRYVTALRAGWASARSRPLAALIWAVDHGAADITRLMRSAIALGLRDAYAADADLAPGLTFLDGQAGAASGDRLAAALAEHCPGVVVTTSHGQTGPLDDAEQMRAQLGWLVDQGHRAIDPAAILAGWQPDGAIWYAHACCSAGADRPSSFAGLMKSGSSLQRVLAGVAALGATTAPLPRALLGAPRPARAFIGHVEPTFDWTLQQPETRQHLTDGATTMLYDQLYAEATVGVAMQAWLRAYGVLSATYDQLQQEPAETAAALAARDQATLYYQLTARDVQSTVLLGDPTAALSGLRPS
jgi:hypothetical protein